MNTATRTLYDLAHARTGDKGNCTNISVIAYDVSDFELLVVAVTAERVAAHFAYRRPTSVTRHLLPRLAAMNFVIQGGLDGGVNESLNLDMHGKSLSYHLLAMSIELPSESAGLHWTKISL